MTYPARRFSVSVVFCTGIFLGGVVLAMGGLGPAKVPAKLLGNWEFEVAGYPNRPSLIIRGFNLESARYVSRVQAKVKGADIIVEVYSSFIHLFVKKKKLPTGPIDPKKIISFEKRVPLSLPVLPEYSIYYRDIDGTLHLIQKVQIPGQKVQIPGQTVPLQI